MGFYGNILQMHLCAKKAEAEGKDLNILSAIARRNKTVCPTFTHSSHWKAKGSNYTKVELTRHERKLSDGKGSK